jgi:aldehyde dehydrogenase (NAD+)
LIAKVKTSGESDYDKVIETAQKAFQEFRLIPAPKRGEIVRQLGLKLREYKEDLGNLFLMKWVNPCRKVLEKFRK